MEEKQIKQLAADFSSLLFEIRDAFRRHYPTDCNIKINSHAFHILCFLNQYQKPKLTMKDLAKELNITSQQLTKLINDLEEKEYVQRLHDKTNRRQVYIHIDKKGKELLEKSSAVVLNSIFETIDSYSDEDKEIMAQAVGSLNQLFLKNKHLVLEKNEEKQK